MLTRFKNKMVSENDALAGRDEPILHSGIHAVKKVSYFPPFPENTEQVAFGMGCFWGAERVFWQLPGVYVTAVGYCGGYTKNPTYEEVCSNKTGHAEAVLVVYEPQIIDFADLTKVFFESHDPTQINRQGNDIGTQYRSAIYCTNNKQLELAVRIKDLYDRELKKLNIGSVTTEITELKHFYYAELYHQQYLEKNPNGYCGLTSLGITCPRPS